MNYNYKMIGLDPFYDKEYTTSLMFFFSIEFLAPAWHPNWIDDLKNEGRSQLLKNKHLFKVKLSHLTTTITLAPSTHNDLH